VLHAKLKILCLGTSNPCRSPMVEGWARHLRGDVIEPWSAGLEKHGLNPHAIKVMAEAGVRRGRIRHGQGAAALPACPRRNSHVWRSMARIPLRGQCSSQED
jgi:protein-tyrosine-phosphatase